MATRSRSTVTADDQLQIQLPMWGGDQRGLPNAFARSALFNVANARKGARENLKRKPIASLKGITITYTGEELRQDDEDAFLQILHIARLQPLGTEVKFTAHSMLVELGWSLNKAGYARLVDCIDRLKASGLAVTVEAGKTPIRQNYTGSLIRSFRWREEGVDAPLRHWEVLLEPEIVALFGPNTYSRLDWKTRLKLPPLAKWLHSFYHSHATPFSYKVETIHSLCGSEIAQLRQFRYKLKIALALLVERGFFYEAFIDARTDHVVVKRLLQVDHQAVEAEATVEE